MPVVLVKYVDLQLQVGSQNRKKKWHSAVSIFLMKIVWVVMSGCGVCFTNISIVKKTAKCSRITVATIPSGLACFNSSSSKI